MQIKLCWQPLDVVGGIWDQNPEENPEKSKVFLISLLLSSGHPVVCDPDLIALGDDMLFGYYIVKIFFKQKSWEIIPDTRQQVEYYKENVNSL